MSGRDGSKHGFQDIVCGPCSKTRVSVKANLLCMTCSEPMCDNCTKIHRTKVWAKKHTYVNISDTKKNSMVNVLAQQVSAIKNKVSEKKGGWGDTSADKASYMDKLASQHDHYQQELDNELFCEQHQVIVCDFCKSKEHRLCKTITPVDEAASSMKKSATAMDVVKNLKSYNKFASLIYEDRLKEEEFLKNRFDELEPYMVMMRVDAGEPINNVEKSMTADFEIIHSENLRNIRRQKERCEKLKQRTKEDAETLRKAFSGSNDTAFVKTFVEILKKVPVYEKFLKEVYDSVTNCDYVYSQKEALEKMKTKLSAIGTIEQVKTDFRLPPFLVFDESSSRFNSSMSSYRDSINDLWLNRRAKTLTMFRPPEDGDSFYITAIACSPKGDVAVVNRKDCSLQIKNESNKMQVSYKCSVTPWDVEVLPNSMYALTITGEKLIRILKIEVNTKSSKKTKNAGQGSSNQGDEYRIEGVRDIQCKGQCWGIVYRKGRLYVTCDAYERKPHIESFNLDEDEGIKDGDQQGKTTTTSLEVANMNEFQFVAPQHIACNATETSLYVTDSELHCVVGFAISGDCTFCYYSRDLMTPTGLTVDRQGNIYVCSKDNSSVHKLSRDGKSGEIILQKEDGLDLIRAITYNSLDGKLYIANNMDRKIRSYII